MNAGRPGEPLVVPLHKPRWAAWSFSAISVGVAGASICWMVLAPSLRSVFFGILGLGSFVGVWATVMAARRTRGAAPLEIVATSEGLRSPIWELDWDRVDRMWIGPSPSGRIRVLNIEPLQPGDIRRPRSATLRFNALAANAMNMPAIQIPQANVDRPLEELANQLEEKAARPLLVRDPQEVRG